MGCGTEIGAADCGGAEIGGAKSGDAEIGGAKSGGGPLANEPAKGRETAYNNGGIPWWYGKRCGEKVGGCNTAGTTASCRSEKKE